MELTMTSSAFTEGHILHEKMSIEEYLFNRWEGEDGYPEDETINNIEMYASKIDIKERLAYVQFCLDCYGSSLLMAFNEEKFKEELKNNNPHCVVFYSDDNSINLEQKNYSFPATFDNRHRINEDYIKYLFQYFIGDKENINKLSWKGLDKITIKSCNEAVSLGLVFGCLGDVEDSFYSGNVKNRIVLAKKIFEASHVFLKDLDVTENNVLNVHFIEMVVSFLKRYNSKEDNAVFLRPFMEENISLLSSGKLSVNETVKRITILGKISEISEMINIIPDKDYINKFMKNIIGCAIKEVDSKIVINKNIWSALEHLCHEIRNSANPMSDGEKKNIDYFRLDLYKIDLINVVESINSIYSKDVEDNSYVNDFNNKLEIILGKNISNKENLLKSIYNLIVKSNLDNLKERCESFQEFLIMKENSVSPISEKKIKVKKF